MRVKTIISEDFVNYKKPSMFIGTAFCSGKCGDACQNKDLQKTKIIEISDDEIIKAYIRNDITEAIVFGGLEPFDQFDELFSFLYKLRIEYGCLDDVVIYTGYKFDEITYAVELLAESFGNIIVKFGRYIPNRQKKFDELLGVTLASDNQYSTHFGRINN